MGPQLDALFHHGVAVVVARGQLAAAVNDGVSQSLWRRVVRKMCREATRTSGIDVRWVLPFAKQRRPGRRRLFAVIEAAIDQQAPVLVALSGAHSYYTVICGYSPSRLALFDSGARHWLDRAGCGPRPGKRLATTHRHALADHPGAGRVLGGPADAPPASPVPERRLTLDRFRLLEAMLRADGYGEMIAWSEGLKPPRDCRTFAKEAIYVVCNSGMSVAIATAIYWKCVRALARGHSAATVFGHPGKAAAINHIWTNRRILFEAYRIAENKLVYCGTLPFIGSVTRHHLAKNLGLNTVKPDVHLARFAKAEQVTPPERYERLAAQSGHREPAVDPINGAPAPMNLDIRARFYLAAGTRC